MFYASAGMARGSGIIANAVTDSPMTNITQEAHRRLR